MVLEQAHNLCCFIETLQDCQEVIDFALAGEKRNEQIIYKFEGYLNSEWISQLIQEHL